MGSIKTAYNASAAVTCTLASLASSSTLVAGRSSAEVDNTTALDLDKFLSGVIKLGTTPTANTVVEIWIIPKKDDTTYFDTFDGTDKAVTVSSRGQLFGYGTLVATINNEGAVTGANMEFFRSLVGSLSGGAPPAKFQYFVTHNTVAALNATGGNHLLYYKGSYNTY
jgi:hypothetical protein